MTLPHFALTPLSAFAFGVLAGWFVTLVAATDEPASSFRLLWWMVAPALSVGLLVWEVGLTVLMAWIGITVFREDVADLAGWRAWLWFVVGPSVWAFIMGVV